MTAMTAIPDPAAFPADDRVDNGPTGQKRERKDHVLPILVVGSLIVHILIFLPSLLSHDADQPSAPREIPVEVIQEPPAPKPPPQAKPKTETAKPEAAKPAQPQPAPQKPAAEKPAPEKPKPEAQNPPAKAAREKPADPPKAPGGEQRMKDLLGPMPAIALPGVAAEGTEEASYEQLVLSKLSKAKTEDRFKGSVGEAEVSFRLDDAGAVASVTLVRPSGIKFLDDEAVAMVHRGEPYPAPPPGGRHDYTFTLQSVALP